MALQATTNSGLGQQAGPLWATLVNFLVGLAVLLPLALLLQPRGFSQVLLAPRHLWVGGLMGAAFVAAIIFLVPRLGVIHTLMLTLFGQLVAAAVIDHFGFLGAPQTPFNTLRALGLVMALGAVWLVKR